MCYGHLKCSLNSLSLSLSQVCAEHSSRRGKRGSATSRGNRERSCTPWGGNACVDSVLDSLPRCGQPSPTTLCRSQRSTLLNVHTYLCKLCPASGLPPPPAVGRGLLVVVAPLPPCSEVGWVRQERGSAEGGASSYPALEFVGGGNAWQSFHRSIRFRVSALPQHPSCACSPASNLVRRQLHFQAAMRSIRSVFPVATAMRHWDQRRPGTSGVTLTCPCPKNSTSPLVTPLPPKS